MHLGFFGFIRPFEFKLASEMPFKQMAGLTQEMSGESGKAARDAVKASAADDQTKAMTRKDLSNYDDGNQK